MSEECKTCKNTKKLFVATHNDGRGYYESCPFCEKFADFFTLSNNYKKLLEFVKQLAHESVYEKYDNLNEINWEAFELIKEIGES